MKKCLLILGAMALMSSTMFGAACANTTVATLTGAGFNCFIQYADFQITFSNFAATGSATTANANVDQTLAVGGNPAIGLGGFSFTGNFTSAFTLGYTATIGNCLAGFSCALTGYVEQVLITPNTSTASVSVVEGAGPSPVVLNYNNQTSSQFQIFSVASTTKAATYNGNTGLISYESQVFGTATSGVPEPMTLSMMGIGLLGLGLMRRRQMGKK